MISHHRNEKKTASDPLSCERDVKESKKKEKRQVLMITCRSWPWKVLLVIMPVGLST
jgi:hypothetical protein